MPFLLNEVSPCTHTQKTQLVVLSCVPTRNRPVTNPGVTSHSLRNADCQRVEDTFGSQSSSRRLYCENDIWAAERASVVRCSLGDVRRITRLSLCIYFSIILLGFTVGSILAFIVALENRWFVFCAVILHKRHIDEAPEAMLMLL